MRGFDSRFMPWLFTLAAILVGCNGIPNAIPRSAQAGKELPVALSGQPNKPGQQEITFGVEWPRRFIQTIPSGTNTVTFFVLRDGLQITKATVFRDPEIPQPTKNVKLFPGDYVVQVRAFESLTPTSASSVLAQGAAAFTVVQGQDLTVEVNLKALESPVPASPFPTATPILPSPTPEASPPPSGGSRDHWTRQLTGTAANLYSVHFVDENSGWAVGDGNHILATGDGGKTWTEQFNEIIPERYTGRPRLFNVRFRDALNGWAVGAQTNNGHAYGENPFISDFATTPTLLTTNDAGLTWNAVLQNVLSGYPFYSVSLTGPSGIFVTGGSYSSSSSDNGATWVKKNFTGLTTFFLDANLGWQVRSNGLYYTNTGGANWAILPTPSGIGNLLNVFFTSATNGSAITDTGTVIRTGDGGANWTIHGSAPSGTKLNKFRFNTQNFGYGTANGGLVYLTTDGGSTWKKQGLADGSGTDLHDASFVDENNGWVVGDGGRIYRYVP